MVTIFRHSELWAVVLDKNHNSSVDFVVYYRLNKKPVFIIEVDGFAFHENSPEQLARDALKNSSLTNMNLECIVATDIQKERKCGRQV